MYKGNIGYLNWYYRSCWESEFFSFFLCQFFISETRWSILEYKWIFTSVTQFINKLECFNSRWTYLPVYIRITNISSKNRTLCWKLIPIPYINTVTGNIISENILRLINYFLKCFDDFCDIRLIIIGSYNKLFFRWSIKNARW